MNRRLNMTLGCFTVFVIVCIFGIEGTLALLRQRIVVASLVIQNSAGVAVTPTPEPTAQSGSSSGPSKAAIDAAPLSVKPDDSLVVDVRWIYHIGPRFPDTNIEAIVQDSKGQIVASASYGIQCGAETLDCNGDKELPLKYGITNGSGTPSNWPADTYSVDVSSNIADLKPTDLLHRSIAVKPAS